jgi:hypothetical protein
MQPSGWDLNGNRYGGEWARTLPLLASVRIRKA